ncbi:hypothetical protein KIW84_062324 [Lathyrus oleraceus]|uniref:Uncharacterized protein n=1 Tax=Pisum sativum TaxID=3888 RepID=A0A9D5A3F7_PEA|nr:hypothetical protein KIW84_062324 [Pisum sativum]
MATSSSSSHDSDRVFSAEHAERIMSFLYRKIIEERAFNLHLDQHHDIHDILKKHKLTYLNNHIQPLAKELVLEFYASWKINLGQRMLPEPNCMYQLMKTSSRTGWPYQVMLDCLELGGRDWHTFCTLIPRKLAVVDLDVSQTKRSLRHATIILLLCRKAGAPEFIDGRIVNLERPLDNGWIAEHPRRTTSAPESRKTEECI